MTPAQKRWKDLKDFRKQFLKLVADGKSSEAVHEKMKQITTTQLRSEIRQDRKKRTA